MASPFVRNQNLDFTVRELLELAAEVARKNPTEDGRMSEVLWEEIACVLKAKGMFMASSTNVIKDAAKNHTDYGDVGYSY